MRTNYVTPVSRDEGPSLSDSLGLNRLAKSIVLKQLEGLKNGRLVVHDAENNYEFGQQEDDVTDGQCLFANMIIHDQSAYGDILTGGSIGAAESYMTGDWSSTDLTMLVRVLANNLTLLDSMEGGIAALSKPLLKLAHSFKRNTPKGSRRNIAAHYDLGNDFFKAFLDPTMMYSSGIFPSESSTMEEASLNKLKRICEKLQIKASDRVVEIGTGWGGFAIYAAKHYGCHVTTTTISDQQYLLAKERAEEEGVLENITFLREDYRDLPAITAKEGLFDKLVSIEMIEAVGWKFYETFYETCSQLLKPSGVMLIQAITIADQRFEQAKNDVDFIKRYIFPGSCIPSVSALLNASVASSDMRLVHHDDFAEHYARTLKAWFNTLHENLDEIYAQGYSNDFIRMWEFYLCYCEGGFAERNIGVSHLVFAKPEYRDERIS